MTISDAESIRIGSRRELFVDDFLVARLTGVALTLHSPRPCNVALVHDEPWEGNTCAYHTVFRDGDLYRMYYRGSHFDFARNKGLHQVTCYAESRDGVTWIKPDLGLCEFQGSRHNNIVWTGDGAHCFVPFRDTNPACLPNEKYKAVSCARGGLCVYVSPDGLRWSFRSERPVITKEVFAFDSQNLAFWDSLQGCYRTYYRMWRDYTGTTTGEVTSTGARAIMMQTSPDLTTWGTSEWLEYPGAPLEELYTNQIVQYDRAPQFYFGFPKRFMAHRRLPGNRIEGLSDAVFMSSRDGVTFRRWTEALVRPGPQRERWYSRNNMTAWGIVETASDLISAPPELSIYLTEAYYETDVCRLRRFAARTDGFVSIRAPLSGGDLITKPLQFTANPDGETSLLLNVSTSAAGSVRCELQNAAGVPLPGFGMDDCDEFYGDRIEWPMSWHGVTELGHLAGAPVILRFELKDADLYALRAGAPES